MAGIVVRQKRGGGVPVGASKLFGSPDVPDSFEWPVVVDGDECFDPDFLCQLNCAELAPHDKKGLLPSKGMLYFFYDFAKSSGDLSDKAAARVVFSTDTPLDELMIVDEDGRDCAICMPKALSFSHAASKTEKLNMLIPLSTDEEEGYTVLFSISSFKIENGNMHFTDIGRLLFLVSTKSLERNDFSDVRVKIVRDEKQ